MTKVEEVMIEAFGPEFGAVVKQRFEWRWRTFNYLLRSMASGDPEQCYALFDAAMTAAEVEGTRDAADLVRKLHASSQNRALLVAANALDELARRNSKLIADAALSE